MKTKITKHRARKLLLVYQDEIVIGDTIYSLPLCSFLHDFEPSLLKDFERFLIREKIIKRLSLLSLSIREEYFKKDDISNEDSRFMSGIFRYMVLEEFLKITLKGEI